MVKVNFICNEIHIFCIFNINHLAGSVLDISHNHKDVTCSVPWPKTTMPLKAEYYLSYVWTFKGLFRRHDFVSLTKSYMILSCMIFLFRRHYNVMCDFFQQ